MSFTSEIKPAIALEDVDKLDIRVGRILKVESMPKTKKALKLTVDFGSVIGQKTVVSAIGDRLNQDDLYDKHLPFIMNLAPREIRGVVSEAMIVLAENENGDLLFVEGNCQAGSVVI